MSEGTPLFCPARQGPGPARIHSGVGTGAATRCQHEGDRTAAGTPQPCPAPQTPPWHKGLAAPPGPAPPLPCPQGVTQARGCAHPGQRQQHPRQLHGVVPPVPGVLSRSAHPVPLLPVPPRQGPPVLEPGPPSPAFLHRLCRPGQTPRAEGTAQCPESPAGNRPAGPPRHLRGVRAQDSHVKGETEADEALGSRDGLGGLAVFVGTVGVSQTSRPGPPLAPPRPNSLRIPCAHQAPGAGVSPCPAGWGAASPAPRAGKRCGASHPSEPKSRVQANGPTQH